MATEHPDDIVCLAHATNPLQAHIWQQALQEQGIQAKVVGDYLDAAIGDIPGAQAELWVRKDDLVRAQEILKQGEDKLKDEPEE